MKKKTNENIKWKNRQVFGSHLDLKKYDNLTLDEKQTLLYQIKSDIYKLEERVVEKKTIFVYLVNLIDKELVVYDKKSC